MSLQAPVLALLCAAACLVALPGPAEPATAQANAALAPLPVGDAQAGRQVFLDRNLGHCLLCHAATQLSAPFQGNIGPDLSDVADRLSAEAIRARVVDPTRLNPDTVMPAYHRTADLQQVAAEYEGQPILDGQQLEDLLAFLLTLKTGEARSTP